MADLESVKNEVAVKTKKKATINELIQKSLTELGKAVPKCMNAERLGRIALTAVRLNPKLAECTPASFLGALFQSAQLGLEPNIEGQAYLIPYKNSKRVGDKWVKVDEVQFQIGYKGYIELFYRNNSAVSIDMHTVYANDAFRVEYGTNANISHTPYIGDRGEVIGYYAIARLNNNGQLFKFMTKDECIKHGLQHSKSIDTNGEFRKDSPWAKDLNAMCKKTVLIQLAKLLPKSVELQKALAMDNTTKSRIDTDMFNIPDDTNWNEEETTPNID